MNSVQLIGNLTSTPETKPVGQSSVCDFSIAINEVWYDAQKVKQEKVHFINCQAWAGMGENIAKYFVKGQKIAVTGALRQDRWEKDGVKHSKLFVRVDGFDFCGGKPGEKGQEKDTDPDWNAPKDAPKGKSAPPKDPDLDPVSDDELPFT